jgi:DNA-binding MarR family transcriptional regulator
MCRGLGRTELRILEYLEEKAKSSKVTELKTIESYARTSEIAEKIRISADCVCQAIDSLEKGGRIRRYPNGRKRNRYFGSLILPPTTEDEVSRSALVILSTNNCCQISKKE